MKKTIASLALLLCAAAPAFAGSVYVPLATDQTIDGIRYRTQVWVTNQGSTEGSFTSYFIPANTNGTVRPDGWGTVTTVPARTAVLLGSVAASGQIGVLEISSNADLITEARMVSTLGDVTSIGTAMPPVSSETLFEQEAISHLQGWVRSATVRTDYGVVNLGSSAATCTVKVLRSGGGQIQDTVTLTLPALGHLHFDDALAILGETSIAGVRSETVCNQPFSTYLRTYDRQSGDVAFIPPAEEVASSTLEPPGTEPPPAGCSTQPGVVCFTIPGTFYIPTPSQSNLRRTFQVPEAAYSSFHLQVEVVTAKFQNPSSGLHQIFWMARNAKNIDLYGFVALRGPNKNQILWRHGVGLEPGDKPKIEEGFKTVTGETYIFDYRYNPKADTIVLEIRDTAGNVLEHVVDQPNVNRVHINEGDFVAVDFSRQKNQHENEPPLYNWKFRNFLLEFIP